MVTGRILTALILIALSAVIGAILDPAFAQRVANILLVVRCEARLVRSPVQGL